jgi:hypothetical protein
MAWSDNGWINYDGTKNVRSTASLAVVPVGSIPGHSLQPQAWTPQENVEREQSQARFATAIAHHAGIATTLTASGERVEALSDDPHYARLASLLEKYGHPKSQEELNAMGKAEGLEEVARQTMQLLYDTKYKPLPSVPAVDGMTFQPQMRSKRPAATERDERGMTFQPSVTMSKKKATDAVEARAQVARDIQASLKQVRALSAGTSPAAAVRAPVCAPRRGLDMVAAARLFVTWMQSQSDTAARREIAAARQEVAALAERIRADRETKRMTGRA